MSAKRTGLLAGAAASLALVVALPAGAGEIILVNLDDPGQGLNDPTPAIPTGLNPGVTLGQQRQVAFFYAAQLWGQVLESDVTVFVGASFQPLTCTATGAVLGSAGATFVIRDFPGASLAGTWYSSALADALAGVDLIPGSIDINSRFNSRLGTDPACLGGRSWYYGLDHNSPPGDLDFLNVVMHEIGHGLGVQGFSNLNTGAFLGGFPAVYEHFTFDNDVHKNWAEMSDAERLASAINSGKVVWSGGQVFAGAALVLLAGTDDLGQVRLYMPNPIEGGSSWSHFDTAADPNLLMEPRITASLRASTNIDLTPALLEDEGWTTNSGTASIAGCDTGVAIYREGGAIVGAAIEAHAAVCSVFGINKGGFVSCMAEATESLAERGVLSGKDKSRVQRCSAFVK